jgi:hypothetical protein
MCLHSSTGIREPQCHAHDFDGRCCAKILVEIRGSQQSHQQALLHAHHGREVESRAVSTFCQHSCLLEAHPAFYSLGARRRWERAQRKAAESRMQSLKVSPFKRLLSEDVLYLMIVNMPTDAELAKAKTDVQAKGTATVGLERGGIDA